MIHAEPQLDNQPVETTVYSLKASAPTAKHRPRAERHLSLFRVGALTIGDRRELCLIRNVSAGGMLIRAYCAIPPGTSLSIELKQGETVTGTARWMDGELVGVEFDDAIDIVSLISPSQDGPRPRMPRIEVDCSAMVREGAITTRTKALNVSQGGLRVVSPTELTIGANVIVTLTGLSPEPAVVRWKDGDCYGIAFNRVLSVSQLVTWLQDQQERFLKAG